MARPSTGPALVQRLAGSDDAKLRTEVVLDTIAGRCTLDDAAERLGVARSYLVILRDQILQGAIAAAEPRKSGPKPRTKEADLIAELAQSRRLAKDLEIALELERCRVELAAVLGPRLKKTPTTT